MLLASLIFSFPVENTTVDSPSSLRNRWQFSLQLFQATNFSPRLVSNHSVSNHSIQIRSVKVSSLAVLMGYWHALACNDLFIAWVDDVVDPTIHIFPTQERDGKQATCESIHQGNS
ncbi:hypothetical protein CKAN_02753000 [Cinnamomum micranthum f. kanehirae]|uniref:Uncharacterized protein n=1 Tax=Cinnamomum micranthum f. kanehirae TaxID=337451 RepID=A0A3S3PC73_9MAGN|nr:hypothetical protein CKAN_02753000 [Cinnamomum micranthum f. kanehirae]